VARVWATKGLSGCQTGLGIAPWAYVPASSQFILPRAQDQVLQVVHWRACVALSVTLAVGDVRDVPMCAVSNSLLGDRITIGAG
jgi:hypothetical protein